MNSEVIIEGQGNKEIILIASNEVCIATDTVYLEAPLGLDYFISEESSISEFEEVASTYPDAVLYMYDLQGVLVGKIFQDELIGWKANRLNDGIYIYQLLFDKGSQLLSGRVQIIE